MKLNKRSKVYELLLIPKKKQSKLLKPADVQTLHSKAKKG